MSHGSFLKKLFQIATCTFVLSVMMVATYVYADKYTWNYSSGSGSVYSSWQKVVLSSSGIGYAFNNSSPNVLYKTTDHGISFNSVTSFTEKIRSIATSEDGIYVIVSTNDPDVANDGYIYTSQNQGGTFTQVLQLGQADWEGVAISEHGQFLYVINASNSYFSWSSDYGSGWNVDTAYIPGATIVRSSNTGNKVIFGGPGTATFYVMDNNSGSLSSTFGIPEGTMADFDITADGQKVSFVPQFGKPWIYASSAWSVVNNLPDTGNYAWKSTVMSGPGNYIAFLRSYLGDLSTNDGALYISDNSGSSYWVEYLLKQTFPGNSWTNVAMSSDAYYMLLTSSAGYVFTGQFNTTLPGISNFTNGANGVYGTGLTIYFRVTTDQPVFFGSSLNITFETGAIDRSCSVTFTDGETVSSPCQYTVQPGDSSSDLSINSISGVLYNENGSARTDTSSFSTWHSLFSTNYDIVVDGVAPTVSLAALPGGQYASGTVSLSATASDNTSVAGVQFRASISGAFTNIGSEDTTSPYSTSFNTTLLSDGTYAIHAVARDANGNYATSTINNVTIDNTAPSAPGTPDLTTASDTGYLSTDNVTASTSPTFTVSCVTGTSVRLLNGGTMLGNATCSSSSATITSSALSVGTYSLVATQTDPAGNTSSTSSALSVTIDTTAPTVSLTSPTNGSSATGTISLVSSASDNVAVYGVQFRNVTAGSDIGSLDTTAPYTVSYDTTTTTDGSTVIRATATDTAGNTSQATTTVTIANTPPSAPGSLSLDSTSDTGTSNSDRVTSDTTPTFTATCQTGNLVAMFRGGSTLVGTSTCSSSSVSVTSATLSAGTHLITSTQTNSVGITSATSSALSVTIDTTAPTVSLTSPTNGSSATGIIELTASSSDISGIAGVSFYVNGLLTGIEGTTSPYSINLDTTTISNGTSTIAAVARDEAGLVSTSTISILINNVATTSGTTTETQASQSTSGPNSAGGIVPISSLPQGLLSGIQQGAQDLGNISRTVVPTMAQEVVRAVISSAGIPDSFVFRRNATIQSVSNEVQNLQRVLNTFGFTVSNTGNGSVGNETRVFGNRTRTALIRFQRAFALPATGFFGPLTRATINSILNTISR